MYGGPYDLWSVVLKIYTKVTAASGEVCTNFFVFTTLFSFWRYDGRMEGQADGTDGQDL